MPQLQHATRKGNVYINTTPTRQGASNLLDILWKYARNKEETVPRKPLGPFYTDPADFLQPSASGLRITLIGHSSTLIEIGGYRILTDPVWAARASFLKSIGPRRFFDAPVPLSGLPPLDAVLISHDHYDHLDRSAIRELARLPVPFYCSEGVGRYLGKWGVAPGQIHELNWGDRAGVNSRLELIAAPARHFSGRGIVHRNETLWSSFIIRTPEHNLYFGADSGYSPDFKTIGALYGPFDLTMLEIGAADPAWADIHMGPVPAVQAHLDLRGNVMMPIHWGTFNLALHAWYEPVETLLTEAAAQAVTLFIPRPGMPTDVTEAGYNSWWWRA